jgi:hypothetical protein
LCCNSFSFHSTTRSFQSLRNKPTSWKKTPQSLTLPALKYKNLNDDEEEQLQTATDVITVTPSRTTIPASTYSSSSTRYHMNSNQETIMIPSFQEELTKLQLTETRNNNNNNIDLNDHYNDDVYNTNQEHDVHDDVVIVQTKGHENLALALLPEDLPKSYSKKTSMAKEEEVKQMLLSIEMFIGRVAIIMNVCVLIQEVMLTTSHGTSTMA